MEEFVERSRSRGGFHERNGSSGDRLKAHFAAGLHEPFEGVPDGRRGSEVGHTLDPVA